MFGYVKPHVPELKVGEYELFRAVYCGVCRSMGKHTGILSRLTLSYDYVFLAAVRMALTETVPECKKRRCIAHPLKKRNMAEENDAFAYTAAAAACMFSQKLEDDASDETGFRKLLSSAGRPFARDMVRRSARKTGNAEENVLSSEKIEELLGRLYELEEGNCSSVDETAEAFGAVLGYVFSCGLSGNAASIASEIGRAAGRFVYICDAADDLTDDIRNGRYNPIVRLWGDMATEERDGKTVMSVLAAESMGTAARMDLEKLGLAVELLPLSHPLVPVIKNIIYLGMPSVMDTVLGKNGVCNK